MIRTPSLRAALVAAAIAPFAAAPVPADGAVKTRADHVDAWGQLPPATVEVSPGTVAETGYQAGPDAFAPVPGDIVSDLRDNPPAEVQLAAEGLNPAEWPMQN